MDTGWEIEFYKDKHAYMDILEKACQHKQDVAVIFLEDALCELTGRKYAVPCASGSDAIECALQYKNVGGEVLTSAFSWLSTATPATLANAEPAFCDIDLDSYHVNRDSFEFMVGPFTEAAVIPQLFGNMSDMAPYEAFCKKNEIFLIEDACQAIGASFMKRPAGSFGDVSVFSFAQNKNVAGLNGGGALLTDDPDVAMFARDWFRHGDNGNADTIGRNSKMYYTNAKIIEYRLKKMPEHQLRRQVMASVYREKLAGYPVHLPGNDRKVDHAFHKYVIRFEDRATRDAVQKEIGGVVHYPTPLPYLNIYETGEFYQSEVDSIENTELACETVLSIPFHHMMDPEDVAQQAEKIKKVLDG